MKKIVATLAAVSAIVMGGAVVAPAASAAEATAPVTTGSGHVVPASSTSTSLSNGSVSLQTSACTSVTVKYSKTGGNPVHFYFGYTQNGIEYTSPYYDESAGQALSYSWNHGTTSGNVVGWIQVDGQGRFQTPSINCA